MSQTKMKARRKTYLTIIHILRSAISFGITITVSITHWQGGVHTATTTSTTTATITILTILMMVLLLLLMMIG